MIMITDYEFCDHLVDAGSDDFMACCWHGCCLGFLNSCDR